MSGLIGSVDGLKSANLLNFLTGKSTATLNGTVEQFRNNISFDYGDILAGATSDGVLFDIRINGPEDFEFGRSLSYKRKLPEGIIDSGDALAMTATYPAGHLEMRDVSGIAYGLLMASKGEIDENELNDNPMYLDLNTMDLKEALDRLNIDAGSRFRVNGVEFQVEGDRIEINSRPGQKASSVTKRDPELARLKKQLASKQEAAGAGLGELQKVDAKGASINDLLYVREVLESNFNYVAYDFKEDVMIGSNRFKDVFDALGGVPDGFYFGANMALQMNQAVGKDVSQTAKNELFPVTLNYFASLMLGAVTGLPAQVREEFEFHAKTVLTNLYRGDEKKAQADVDALRPAFEETVFNLFDTVSEIEKGAELKDLRKGMGITFDNGNTYTVRKYTFGF